MANTIQHKRSATASAIPTAGSLVAGELAVNTADGKLFLKKDNSSVVEIGGAAAAGTLTGITLASNVVTSSLTQVGTLEFLNVTNTIGGSISGNAATATSASNALTANTATTATSALTAATVTTAAQPTITSVGTLTSVNTSGVITGTNTTASTSSTTGALKIAGGTGIVGSLNVGGVITGSTITSMFGQYAYSAAAYNYDGSSVIPRYGSPHINANNAAGNMATDTVYFNLIHISKAVTINKILAYCGTGGGGTGNVRYGIYSVSSTGYPDQRLYGSGSIAFTGVATTQISVTGVATQLNAGWYFLAAIFSDTAGAKAYALSTIGFHAFGQTNAVMTSSSRAMYYDDTADLAYGFTLQTSYSTANMYVEKGITTVRIPALYFEVA